MRFLSVLITLLAGTEIVRAHRSPANCGGGGLAMSVYAFRLNGSVANTITNGERIVYTIQIQNDSQKPTPGGNVPSCDITCATVRLYCPDTNGNPGPLLLVATNVNLPFGTPPFIGGSITCTVATASGIRVAQAIANVSGVLHHATVPGCTPDAYCVTNQCDPDVDSVTQSVSVYVQPTAASTFHEPKTQGDSHLTPGLAGLQGGPWLGQPPPLCTAHGRGLHVICYLCLIDNCLRREETVVTKATKKQSGLQSTK